MSPRTHPAEAARRDLIARVNDVRHKLLKTAAGLAPRARDEVFLGTWSARDLTAHLIGWDHANVDAIGEVLDAELPSFYEMRDRDWKAYNALLVERYRKPIYRELLRDTLRSHPKLTERVAQTPAVDLRRDIGIRTQSWRVTIECLLKTELADERIHLGQLEGRTALTPRGRAFGDTC